MPPQLTKTTLLPLFIHMTLIISLCLCGKTRLRNKLDVKFNLDCHKTQCTSSSANTSAVNLFQVISSNPESTYLTNYIWSTIGGTDGIGGPPMVITTSSSQESNLNINWTSLLEAKSHETSGFHFNVTPDSSIGLLVEQIFIFNDADGSGLVQDSKGAPKPIYSIDWSDIIWDLASRTTYLKGNFLYTNLRMRFKDEKKGSILIRLAIPRDDKADRQKELPHLKLIHKSVSVTLVIDGLQYPSTYTHPRLGMVFVFAVQSLNGKVLIEPPSSESLISDELTPGVFRIKSLQFESKQGQTYNVQTLNENDHEFSSTDGSTRSLMAKTTLNSDKLGFLYWKEVAYTDRRKLISRTIDATFNDNNFDNATIPLVKLTNISQPFYQYFNYLPESGPKPRYDLFKFQLIFGKGDTSYSLTNFTDFSFVFGLGAAPQEQTFSILVRIIIFVCFCLPILVMIGGLGYLTLRRFRRSSDTELLLAAES